MPAGADGLVYLVAFRQNGDGCVPRPAPDGTSRGGGTFGRSALYATVNADGVVATAHGTWNTHCLSTYDRDFGLVRRADTDVGQLDAGAASCDFHFVSGREFVRVAPWNLPP